MGANEDNDQLHEPAAPDMPRPKAPPLSASQASASSIDSPAVQPLSTAWPPATQLPNSERIPDDIPTLAPGGRRGAVFTRFSGTGVLPRPLVERDENRARVITIGLVVLAMVVLVGAVTFNAITASEHSGPSSPDVAQSSTQVVMLGTTTPDSAQTTNTPVSAGSQSTPTIQATGQPIGVQVPTTVAGGHVTPTTNPQPTSITNPLPTSTANPQPTSTALPAPTATALPPPTATPIPSCAAENGNGSDGNFFGDAGHSGTGALLGDEMENIAVTRYYSTQKNGCVASEVKMLEYVHLVNSYAETNGSNCYNSPHSCGEGSCIQYQGQQSGGQYSVCVPYPQLYGIWAAPFGPRWLYGVDDTNPGSQLLTDTSVCAYGYAWYYDNWNVVHQVSNTPTYCFANAN